MDNDGYNSEKHLQTLPQLQATGAEVMGADGEKVGDLGEVNDSHFTVSGRGLLKGDLHIPNARVAEITSDDRIVLDVEAAQVKGISLDKPSSGQTDPHAPFSEDVAVERGAWGMSHRKDD